MLLTVLFPAFYLITGILCIGTDIHKCPCADQKECDHPVRDIGMHKEVFVFSHGTVNVQPWNWKTFTALIVPSSFNISNTEQANTMCTAHRNQRKFGITVEMSFSGTVNDTSDQAEDWIHYVVSQLQDWHAEIIVVDLLPYFTTDIYSSEQDHIAVVKILSHMKTNVTELSEVVKIACIIPWKPPCAETETSCDFTSLSKDVCDYFVINPDSFTDLDDVKCRARANIPFSKLLYGISEYNSHHIPNNRIILGVAWHGYDYTCETLINEICSLQEVTSSNSTQTKCNFSKRWKVSNGDILKEHAAEHMKHTFDNTYMAPFFSYSNSTDGHQHQVWFEDQSSLIVKYKLVAELKLKGLAVLYGDDLASSKSPLKLMNDNDMWTWVAHEFILSVSGQSLSERLHYADTTAIVAVACLILGTILGIVFTCFGLRIRVKKPKYPFQRDADGDMDEYTDEDPNL
uniref:GH18 domain-containing protein n=1 Tax=Arion vulgaris TaxID=1028688 RepID=A0A0B6Z3W6_9EUPU